MQHRASNGAMSNPGMNHRCWTSLRRGGSHPTTQPGSTCWIQRATCSVQTSYARCELINVVDYVVARRILSSIQPNSPLYTIFSALIRMRMLICACYHILHCYLTGAFSGASWRAAEVRSIWRVGSECSESNVWLRL